MLATIHKSCSNHLIKTRKIVENYLINGHGGKNPELLNEHAGK